MKAKFWICWAVVALALSMFMLYLDIVTLRAAWAIVQFACAIGNSVVLVYWVGRLSVRTHHFASENPNQPPSVPPPSVRTCSLKKSWAGSFDFGEP